MYLLIGLLSAFLVSMAFMFTREDPQAIYKKNSDLRVEVLNGCAVNRLGIKVANLLRRDGFNVVKIGNTDKQYFKETIVIERSDEKAKHAAYFAKRIRCKNIGRDIDSALYLDVTVIVGEDYKKLFPNAEKEF